MVEHLAEKTKELSYNELNITNKKELNKEELNNTDILLLSFPSKGIKKDNFKNYIDKYLDFLSKLKNDLKDKCYIIIYADNIILSLLAYGINEKNLFNYQTWISVRQEIINKENALPNETKGALIVSKSYKKLKICKVRLPYTYCPACNRTTKDYGGKKHLYHEYGTLMRDVWKDFKVKKNEELPDDLITRIKDMFSIEPFDKMTSISLWDFEWDKKIRSLELELPKLDNNVNKDLNRKKIDSRCLKKGDVIAELKKIKTNSIDYIFTDPPYNLKKKYYNYHDNLEIEEYFSWCDEWLNELCRVLKPGKFLSVLNLPLYVSRYFSFLISKMEFSSWITWDALSRPARKIMPANYTILTVQKEKENNKNEHIINTDLDDYLRPEIDNYCRRKSCRKKRETKYKKITDLWTDIPRVKHNSRRYDHPTQLPPKLMKRLISIYSNKGDIVLDCFNGVGTTTLSAHVLERKYIGIEKVSKYHETALKRHDDANKGLDPFRKNNISAKNKTKNNNEKRRKSPDKKYGYSKKDVQLKMKDLSNELEKIPDINEALEHLDIPKEFYEKYFHGWSEVVAACKTTGMTEYKDEEEESSQQMKLNFE